MELRELRADEYDKLELHPAAKAAITPENSTALGAFDESGNLIGQMLLLEMAHVEGTHVIEEKRGSPVYARLDKKMEQVAREKGLTTLIGYVGDPKIGEYCTRLGWKKLPVEVYIKEL